MCTISSYYDKAQAQLSGTSDRPWHQWCRVPWQQWIHNKPHFFVGRSCSWPNYQTLFTIGIIIRALERIVYAFGESGAFPTTAMHNLLVTQTAHGTHLLTIILGWYNLYDCSGLLAHSIQKTTIINKLLVFWSFCYVGEINIWFQYRRICRIRCSC